MHKEIAASSSWNHQGIQQKTEFCREQICSSRAMAYKGLNLLSLFWNNFKLLVGSLQERNSFYGQKAREKRMTCPLPPLLKCNGGGGAFFKKPDKIFHNNFTRKTKLSSFLFQYMLIWHFIFIAAWDLGFCKFKHFQKITFSITYLTKLGCSLCFPQRFVQVTNFVCISHLHFSLALERFTDYYLKSIAIHGSCQGFSLE